MASTKRRGLVALLAVAVGLSSMGCAGGTGMAGRRAGLLRVGDTKAAVIPPLGILFSRVRAPATAAAPIEIGSRKGEATVNQLAIPPIPGIVPPIPLVAWGDVSKEEAARNGGLTRIDHMDYELTVVLMVYRRFKLIAYGE